MMRIPQSTMAVTCLILTCLLPAAVLGQLSSDCMQEDLPHSLVGWQDELADSAVTVEWGFGQVSDRDSCCII